MVSIVTAKEITQKKIGYFIEHYKFNDRFHFLDVLYTVWWQHILKLQFNNLEELSNKLNKAKPRDLRIILDVLDELNFSKENINSILDKNNGDICPLFFENYFINNEQKKRLYELKDFYDFILSEIIEIEKKYYNCIKILEQLEIAYYTNKIKICGEWKGEETRIIVNDWEEIENLFNANSIPQEIIELYEKTAKEIKTGKNNLLMYLYFMQGMNRKSIAEKLGLSKNTPHNISDRKRKGREKAQELNLPDLEQFKKK